MQIEKDNMGYWLRLNKGKHTGKDVFRAMKGSNGTYLVRHVENLFTYRGHQRVHRTLQRFGGRGEVTHIHDIVVDGAQVEVEERQE